MSESPFPGDLLSSLAANPELLKNAMQMASALASSGVLDGLLSKSAPSGESPADRSAPPPPPLDSPYQARGASGGGSTGDFAGLLAGLMGNHPQQSHETRSEPSIQVSHASTAATGKDGASSPTHAGKKSAPPCHNDRVQLLKAVRPFLPEDKREKIDFFIQLLGLLYSAEQMGLRKLF